MNLPSFDSIVAVTRDNLDTLMKGGIVTAEGLTAVINAYATVAKQSLANGSNAFKALPTVRNATDLQAILVSLAKANMETATIEGRAVQELVKGLVNDSVTKLAGRIQATTSLFSIA